MKKSNKVNSKILPIMPKATAVWLIDNTSLTFEQIADFSGMHILEIAAIADEEVARGMIGVSPITSGQVTQEEIDRCTKDPTAMLKLSNNPFFSVLEKKRKGGKYTPVSKRQDKPYAISWLIKRCPDIADSIIVKLLGTTKNTVQSIREKTYWNIDNIKPKDPVLLGLCTQSALDKVLKMYNNDSDNLGKEEN